MVKHPSDVGAATVGTRTPAGAENGIAVPFWQVFVLGIATTLFGIAVLAWPIETLRTLGALVGIWLIVIGAVRIFGALSPKRKVGRQLLSGIFGVLLLIVGVACLRNAAKGILVLAMIIALAWLLIGVAELVIAFRATGGARIWLTVLGVVSIVIGLAFMFWPGLSLTRTVILTGISGLIIGIGEIVFAIQMRRATAKL
jgi:uncharacterized membrane protein HdeD (DUF308 family)